MTQRFEGRLEEHRLVAILRAVPDEHVVSLAEALVEGGFRLLEVALSDEGALPQIERLREALPEEVGVGAGTVTSLDLARAARRAGAEFFVTPHVARDVNAFALEHDVGLICGAFTPSEISLAREGGSRYVKLFPASLGGPDYVKALLGPYPDLKLVAVGGVGVDNVAAYLKAGAVGAGIGSSLTKLDWRDPDFGASSDLARRLVAAVRGVSKG